MQERRRSKRLPFTIPVKVYGRTPRNQPFRDVTATMIVSRDGGLLDLAPRVPVRTEIQTFPLAQANEALQRLRQGHIRGAAVLLPVDLSAQG